MFLITSDLHLTDRAKDSYRFGIFKWLREQQKIHKPAATLILGDVTDFKDGHSSTLVNRIVDELTQLKPPVFILRGNHDGISPKNPFFRFLNEIEGVRFFVDPEYVKEHNLSMIPHQATQQEFDKACKIISPGSTVCIHQLMDGAISESNSRLSGFKASPIEATKPGPVWAGDVHKPQQVGLLSYIGAPYRIRFGDDFTPRVVLADSKGHVSNLMFPCMTKWSLTITEAEDLLHNKSLKKGDQVKIKLELAREELVEWQSHKKRVVDACRKLGLENYGVELQVKTTRRRERLRIGDQVANTRTPEDVLLAYCASQNVAANLKEVGLELLKD